MLKALVLVLVFPILALAHPDHEGSEAAEKPPLFPPKVANKAMATRPAAPELSAPAFMATVTGGSVTLKWQPVNGVSHYQVQIATDPNFKWLVTNENLFTGTTFDAKNLEPGKHYYWRVASQKPDNDPSYTKSAFAKSMFETPQSGAPAAAHP